jgi:ferredoxin
MAAEGSTPAVRVSVDERLCAASAMCKRIAPQIFKLDEHDEIATVLMPTVSDPELIALAREAESNCPTLAVDVE